MRSCPPALFVFPLSQLFFVVTMIDDEELIASAAPAAAPKDLTEAFAKFLVPLYKSPLSQASDDQVKLFLADLGGMGPLLEMLSDRDADPEIFRFVRMACNYVFNNTLGQSLMLESSNVNQLIMLLENGEPSDAVSALGALRHGLQFDKAARIQSTLFEALLRLMRVQDTNLSEQASFVILEQHVPEDIGRFFTSRSVNLVFTGKDSEEPMETERKDELPLLNYLNSSLNMNTSSPRTAFGLSQRSTSSLADFETLKSRVLSLSIDLFSRCPSIQCKNAFETQVLPSIISSIFPQTVSSQETTLKDTNSPLDPLARTTALSLLAQAAATKHGVLAIHKSGILGLLSKYLLMKVDAVILKARGRTLADLRRRGRPITKTLEGVSEEQYLQPLAWVESAFRTGNISYHDVSAFEEDEEDLDVNNNLGKDKAAEMKQLQNQSLLWGSVSDLTTSEFDLTSQILRFLPVLFTNAAKHSTDLSFLFSVQDSASDLNSTTNSDCVSILSRTSENAATTNIHAVQLLPLLFCLFLQVSRVADQTLHSLAGFLQIPFLAAVFTFPHLVFPYYSAQTLLDSFSVPLPSVDLSPLFQIYSIAVTDQDDLLQCSAYFALSTFLRARFVAPKILATNLSTMETISPQLARAIQVEDFSAYAPATSTSGEKKEVIDDPSWVSSQNLVEGNVMELYQKMIFTCLQFSPHTIPKETFQALSAISSLPIKTGEYFARESVLFKEAADFQLEISRHSEDSNKLIKLTSSSVDGLLDLALRSLTTRAESVLEDKQLTTHMLLAAAAEHGWFVKAALLHPTFDLWLCSSIHSATGQTAQACFEWKRRIASCIATHGFFNAPATVASSPLIVSALTKTRVLQVARAKSMADLDKNSMPEPVALIS